MVSTRETSHYIIYSYFINTEQMCMSKDNMPGTDQAQVVSNISRGLTKHMHVMGGLMTLFYYTQFSNPIGHKTLIIIYMLNISTHYLALCITVYD